MKQRFKKRTLKFFLLGLGIFSLLLGFNYSSYLSGDAEVTAPILVAGQTSVNDNASPDQLKYSSDYFQEDDNFSQLGSTNVSITRYIATNKFQFWNNSSGGSIDYNILNNKFNMTQPLSLQGLTMGTDSRHVDTVGTGGSGNYASNAGDALGLILTGSNVAGGQGGGGLGLYGLPNSYFFGRDFFVNSSITNSSDTTIDNYFGVADSHTANGSIGTGRGSRMDQVAIRSTDASGKIINGTIGGEKTDVDNFSVPLNQLWANPELPTSSNYPVGAVGVNPMTVTATATGTQDALTTDSFSGGDSYNLSWQPTSQNSDGTMNGNLTFTLVGKAIAYSDFPGNAASYPSSVTLSQQVTSMPRNMSFGMVASTGSQYSILTAYTGNAVLTAYYPTQPVVVHYVNAITGETIASDSQITSRIGDAVGVYHSNSTAPSASYDYQVPSLAGYTPVAIGTGNSLPSSGTQASLTTEDFVNGSESNPNIITVAYQPNLETAHFVSYYTIGTPGTGSLVDSVTGLSAGSPSSHQSFVSGNASTLSPLVPSTIDGEFSTSISPIPSLSVPTGYHVAEVVGPDGTNGQTYPDLASAVANNPTFSDSSLNSWANYFIVYLSANASTATFSYQYIAGTPSTAPALPSVPEEEGLTGGVIGNPSSRLPALPDGASIQAVIGPDGQSYSSLSEALASGTNQYFSSSGHSSFTLEVSAASVPMLDTVPDIHFGTQTLKSGEATYETKDISPGLQVTDNRSTGQRWSVSVEMSQQFSLESEEDNEVGGVIRGATLTLVPESLSPSSDSESGSPSFFPVDLTAVSEDGGGEVVMNASSGEGRGSWNLNFSNALLITSYPAIRTNVSYTATLLWYLNDVPQN
ncbi:WxL domain-containing protein [Lactococcus nasutitermitis]|uniref:WxL domain-containing protein n=1 Tax=Lactococcus nasutitermitis TaxID=1652957 RepID=A0ABV9JBF4_9LACT|nr:WxL domain-containing protein [Lactococcus nasutitermitis]